MFHVIVVLTMEYVVTLNIVRFKSVLSRVDNYLGRVSNGPINCDTTARMFTSVFTKYTELISVIFKFMGVVEKMALEACRKL